MRKVIAIIAACVVFSAGAAAESAHETVTPNFAHPLPNAPGKLLRAVIVDYPPGAASLPHSHAKSAFIYAYVVSGSIETQLAGEAVRVLRAGESFYELPGSHHLVSRNASATEPARLLAVFVVDEDDTALTTPDR
jgi:quercetin dioxygenase-like cupin family protein